MGKSLSCEKSFHKLDLPTIIEVLIIYIDLILEFKFWLEMAGLTSFFFGVILTN